MKTVVLILAIFCSCPIQAQISDAEFTANKQASLIKLAKYIQDTASFEVRHSDKRGTIERGEDSLHRYYFFYYKNSGLIKGIQVNSIEQDGPQRTILFNTSGIINYETIYVPHSKSFPDKFENKAIQYYDSGAIKYICEYLGGKKEVCTFYREDDGSLDEIANYENNRPEGKREIFYRSGKLKTVYHYSKGKIVTIEEYEENGNKIAATKVENGNGYYLGCSPDGGYCCECYVVKGKLVNCKSLDPPKAVEKRM